MTELNRRQLLAGGAAVGAATGIGLSPASAQAWPSRPVTFVCPWGAGGGTDQTARIVASILARTPMNRWGTPEDISGVVVFLASEAARFVTGAIIPVDGGYLAV